MNARFHTLVKPEAANNPPLQPRAPTQRRRADRRQFQRPLDSLSGPDRRRTNRRNVVSLRPDEAGRDGAEVAARQRLAPPLRALARMLADPGWDTALAVAAPARLLLDQALASVGGAAPPGPGPSVPPGDRVALAPALADELAQYRAFCRARAVESRLRGCEVGQVPLRRTDWADPRYQAQAEAVFRHLRAVRGRSYLPAPLPLLRVC